MTDAKKPDYRDTVFLPKTEFPMRGSLPQKEPELLARWRDMDLYGRLRKTSKGREQFILHDGPPYANGNIHIGTALTKILKDTINRSWQMLGYDAPWVPGWDCHGLPIEWKIEEQYRAQGKDKDAVPKLQFRAECRAFAEKWKNTQSEEFQRLGCIADWAHPYTTMTKKAEAQILREIYKFLDNGLLYQGVKPVMWSVVEKTALAEAEIEYHDHKSTTIWVKFPVVKSPNKDLNGASIVIWTTTPWTIPGNRAIAFGDCEYVLFGVEEVGEGALAKAGDKLVVAEALLGSFLAEAKITRTKIIAAISGADLAKTVTQHPFRGRAGTDGYFDYDVPLYHGDFVTTDAGTGFVHIAPGHGEDDFNLGQKNKIKFDETVGDDGRYLPNVKGFAGLYVYKPDGKIGEANGAVIKALSEAGALLAKKNITHSYPHSWRSKAPLIFRTTPQWFIALDAPAKGQTQTLRQLALKAIGDTKWYPGVGENRITGMIENRPDWCISRQRAWGVPIALFVHKKTNEVLRDKAVLDRVVAAFEAEGADAWYSRKPQEFLGTHKPEDYQQVFDIVDVWFESGSTHAFVLNQKLGVSEWPEQRWPADLYCEGSDQHRGWFHSSLLESCGTLGAAPYKSVVTNGFVLDEQGRKMSKSLGNVVVPQEVNEKMGADILRLWVATSDYTEDLRVGPEILKQTGDLYRRLRNTLRYLLGALDGMSTNEHLPVAEMPELERWVLHRLSALDAIVRADIGKFDFNHILTEVHNFCAVDLSAFYFDVRKDSLYCDRPDSKKRRAARTVMQHLFDYLVAWLAPVLCFTAEEAWIARHGAENSVHMQVFPEAPKSWKNEQLSQKWDVIREIRSVVTGELEVARNKKEIGSSLQAHPVVHMHPEHAALFKDLDFDEICICSGANIKEYTGQPKEGFANLKVPDIRADVHPAKGKKCERCWRVLPEVGAHADHPDLCNRCHDAVLHLRKEAA
jgi:isoleucyl-tRNA synthetase